MIVVVLAMNALSAFVPALDETLAIAPVLIVVLVIVTAAILAGTLRGAHRE